MNKYIWGFTVGMFLLSSCGESKSSYTPVTYKEEKEADSPQTEATEDREEVGFKIPYKQTREGVKTVHVKFNDAAGFDAIFDTGCSGMSISLQEARSLVKAGTLKEEDLLTTNRVMIANGEIVENAVFNIHEVSLTDTKGRSHIVYDIPVTVMENPRADVLVGNVVIDRLAKYAYTIDFQQQVIIFQ